MPLDEAVVGPVRRQLFILLGGRRPRVARGVRQRGESAARARVGAVARVCGANGDRRRARHVSCDSSSPKARCCRVAGGGLALLVVTWGLPVLLSMPGLAVPRADEIGVDWRVIGVLCWSRRSSRASCSACCRRWPRRGSNAQEALKSGVAFGRSSRFLGRFRDALAVVGGGAGVRARHWRRVCSSASSAGCETPTRGLATTNVLTMHLAPSLKPADYCRDRRPRSRRCRAFAPRRSRRCCRSRRGDGAASFSIEGRPPATPGRTADRSSCVTSRRPTSTRSAFRFFAAAGSPTADVPESQRVIIVNETLARRYFGGTDPVGQKTDRGVIVGRRGRRPPGRSRPRDAAGHLLSDGAERRADRGHWHDAHRQHEVPAPRTLTGPIRELVGRALSERRDLWRRHHG